MPPNGPDEWRARIGHWENRKLRWYQAHCGSRPRVPLHQHLGQVISEAPYLCVLLLLWLAGKAATGGCEAGNGALSSLGRYCTCTRREKVSATPLLCLCLALSLLLLVAGDVETNPGPISSEDCKALVQLMSQLLLISLVIVTLLNVTYMIENHFFPLRRSSCSS